MVGFLSRKSVLTRLFLLPESPFDSILQAMDPIKKKTLLQFLFWGIGCSFVFCLVFFLRKPYTLKSGSDACFITGALGLAGIGMTFVVRSGSFDVLNYGVYRLFESFRLDRKKRWDTAGDYKLDMDSKRHKNKALYWPAIIVSGVYLTIALVLTIIVLVG